MYFTGYNRTLHRNVRHDGGKKRTFTRNYVINRRTRARCKGSILVMKLTIILLIFCFSAKGQQDTCLPFPDDPTCGCTFSDGKTIDLRSLGNRNGSA